MIFGDGILLNDLHGSAGGARVRGAFGSRLVVPSRSVRTSSSPLAVYSRNMYTVIEALWQALPFPKQEAWAHGAQAKNTTGRGQFGRVNWYQVDQYDEYQEDPPARVYAKSPKGRLAGGKPVRPDLLACLGGGWKLFRRAFRVGTGEYRRGTGHGVTLNAAWANAWADLAGQAWMGSPAPGCSLIAYWWEFEGQFEAEVTEKRCQVFWPAVVAVKKRGPTLQWRVDDVVSYFVGKSVVSMNELTTPGAGVYVLRDVQGGVAGQEFEYTWEPFVPAGGWAPPGGPYSSSGFSHSELALIWEARG